MREDFEGTGGEDAERVMVAERRIRASGAKYLLYALMNYLFGLY
jgi:hypothetical protein